jgi:thiol-disulfide isomerase/thioredoxin
MYLRKFSLLVFLLTLSLGTFAQGIDFFHGTWEEALAKSEAEGKLIFVDAYTTWCGPCKRMSADVFPLEEVGDVFNANFINVKLDMEKEESSSFREVHRVRAYPTLFFINARNEAVHTTVGGKQAASLITEANAAIAKMDDIDALAARWDAGERDPKLAFTYVRALVRRDQPHLRVANDYLRDQKDLTTEYNLNLIQTAATTADSRIFDLLLKHKVAAIALNGQEAFDATVARAVKATKAKALEYKDAGLLEAAVKKLATVDPAGSKLFALEGEFELAATGHDDKAFTKAMKKYLAKGVNGDPARLQAVYQVASSSKFIENDDVLEMAVEAAATAAAAEKESFSKYYRLASFLLEQKRSDLALKYANMAKEAIPENKANYQRAVEGLIKKIQEAR